MPCCCSSAAGPMPESWSSCGEPIAPAARIISPRAAACDASPSRRKLDARRAPAVEHGSASTCAPVITVRFGRCSAGRRNALAALQRTPRCWLTSKNAAALVVAAVEVVGRRDAGLGRRLAERVEDVPAQPLLARPATRRRRRAGRSRRREWSSMRLKNGSTSSQPQPALPSWRQLVVVARAGRACRSCR